jgi:hypothetical protein
MLLYDMRWNGDDVDIEFFEIDGRHETYTLPIAEIVDIQTWMETQKARILDTYRRKSKQFERRKDFLG